MKLFLLSDMVVDSEYGVIAAAVHALCRGQPHVQYWRSTAKADNGTLVVCSSCDTARWSAFCVVFREPRWRASNNNSNNNNNNNNNNKINNNNNNSNNDNNNTNNNNNNDNDNDDNK